MLDCHSSRSIGLISDSGLLTYAMQFSIALVYSRIVPSLRCFALRLITNSSFMFTPPQQRPCNHNWFQMKPKTCDCFSCTNAAYKQNLHQHQRAYEVRL